ncbi:unnamed protein product, partial [Linum tenue]
SISTAGSSSLSPYLVTPAFRSHFSDRSDSGEQDGQVASPHRRLPQHRRRLHDSPAPPIPLYHENQVFSSSISRIQESKRVWTSGHFASSPTPSTSPTVSRFAGSSSPSRSQDTRFSFSIGRIAESKRVWSPALTRSPTASRITYSFSPFRSRDHEKPIPPGSRETWLQK